MSVSVTEFSEVLPPFFPHPTFYIYIYICTDWIALESGDFSAALDRVNHQGILYKLCSVGIGGLVLSILTQCLSDLSQHVMVDGCRSKLFVSGVPQGSI